MKKIGILLIAFALVLVSCKQENKNNNEKSVVNKTSIDIPFEGIWSRSFEMGNGVSAKVTYSISKDSIHYDMKGPMNMQYTIKKDTFVAKDNKWIGEKGETPYVIFVKNTSKDSISLLKMKVESIEKALEMKFPSDTARSKFSSWNTYYKK